MSTIAPKQPASSPLYRTNFYEYERMAAAGVLADERVELIDGYLVRKMAKSPPHSWTTTALVRMLEAMLPPRWTTRQHQPVRIPDFDEPEPDVTILRGANEDYAHRHPERADVALVVEVSDATLDYDQGVKLSAYAKGAIPVYWIVNLVDRQVEVYSGPRPDGYATCDVYRSGQHVPLVLDGVVVGQIAVDDILP
jgi:Uma2 family endonuclease